MKELVVILAIVGLLLFGAFAVAATLDSAAAGWAQGQAYQMQRDVSIAQIEAQTQIRLRELQMLENAYSRSLFIALFWPIVAFVALLLASSVWFMVWREDRRQRYGCQQQLPDTWRPALPASHYTRFEWETLQMERDYYRENR